MTYTLYAPLLGEVTLHFDTIKFNGFDIYMTGYDINRNRIDFTLDRFFYPDDRPFGCGFCHIKSYIKNNTITPCNIYRTLY